jgi:glutamine---fructose-6-phosphate transaminase (isomerizing)
MNDGLRGTSVAGASFTDGARLADSTRMFQEAASASHAVRAQLAQDAQAVAAIGAEVRRLAPRAVVTCARGSSDHAATYAKYLIETRARILTSSAAPSVSSVYGVTQDLRECLFIAISQSGRSPDLLASVAAAKASGATILALCNDPSAPLIAAADLAIDLRAGPETSVAATKSYLATLAALARFVAAWTADAELMTDLETLPALMDASWALDWSPAVPVLRSAIHLYVIGRGLGLGAAQETALKCKETCGLHAEAFSSAEVRHGPFTLLGPGFPALFLAQNDATRAGIESVAGELAQRGVDVIIAGARTPAEMANVIALPTLDAAAALGPILQVQSAYRLIAALSVERGFDPDHPAYLRKVTETI